MDATSIHAHGYRAGMTALRDRSRLRPLVVTWHNAVIAPGPRGLVMRMGQRLVATRRRPDSRGV